MPQHVHGAWIPVEWEYAFNYSETLPPELRGRFITRLLCGVGECGYVREVTHNG